MNLCGQEAGKPEFWSPSKVLAANQYQAAQDTEIQAKKLQTADRAAKAAANKVQKQLLKEEAAVRRLERERERKLKAEQKAHVRMEKQAQILAKKQAQALNKMSKEAAKAAKLAKPPKPARKAPVQLKVNVVVPRVEIEGLGTTSRGRAHKLPTRYKN